MFSQRSFSVIFFILLAFAVTYSQKIDEKQQELENRAMQLVDQAVSETALLKLSDNRAMIYAMAGNLVWKKDEKRGRKFYQDAADNLIAFINAPVENTSSTQTFSPLGRQDIYNLRRMVLMSLVKRDADFAMRLLLQSRPPELVEAMANYAAPQTTQDGKPAPRSRNDFMVEQEIRLEQSIAAESAADDPQKAAKILRESLAKGFSFEMYSLLLKILQKDESLANTLASEVVQKMISADLMKNRNDLSFAVNFLRTYGFPSNTPAKPGEKPTPKIKIEDKELKDLANKIADSLMKTTNYSETFMFDMSLPTLQKFIPERIQLLKQKQAALKKQTPANMSAVFGSFSLPQSLNKPNATAEEMVADISKAPPQMRSMMYRQAASRAVQNGETEKIRGLLQNQPASKDRDDAISFLDARTAEKKLSEGKVDEARKIIDQMPVGNDKVEQIVKMAVTSYKSNTKESKEAALSLIEEARQMIKDFPEDKDETDGLLKVVAGFAVIDPPRAFSMLSPVIEQTNDLINASATLAKYNKQNQFFRDGEIVMSNNLGSISGKLSQYGKELKLLAEADFDRTRGLIDQFRRDDVRVFTKIFIAQSILQGNTRFSGGGVITTMPVLSYE